jgi:hypothetical protein
MSVCRDSGKVGRGTWKRDAKLITLRSGLKYNKAMPDRQVNLGHSKPPDVSDGSSARTIPRRHSAGRHLAKRHLEEIDFPELTADKLEQCVHDFIVEIFRRLLDRHEPPTYRIRFV